MITLCINAYKGDARKGRSKWLLWSDTVRKNSATKIHHYYQFKFGEGIKVFV